MKVQDKLMNRIIEGDISDLSEKDAEVINKAIASGEITASPKYELEYTEDGLAFKNGKKVKDELKLGDIVVLNDEEVLIVVYSSVDSLYLTRINDLEDTDTFITKVFTYGNKWVIDYRIDKPIGTKLYEHDITTQGVATKEYIIISTREQKIDYSTNADIEMFVGRNGVVSIWEISNSHVQLYYLHINCKVDQLSESGFDFESGQTVENNTTMDTCVDQVIPL